MLDAEEARALARKYKPDINDISVSLSRCTKDISRAANNGRYSTVFHGTLNSKDIKLLEEKGFKVSKHTVTYHDICCLDTYYEISWEEHN